MSDLRIASGFALPLDVAGEALGLIATRGAGKSYTSAVLVEELYRAGVQTIVLDPTGVYWGLRGSGEKEGLPLYVFGGPHGDVPLEATAGALFADLAVDDEQSFVLDLSAFDTKAEQTRFVTAFAERLYRRKAQNRTTLHLVIDEADEFAPQRPMRDEPRMLGAMESIVRRGRSRGLGTTLITQRSASLNKNVLDLIDTLIVMRVTGPRDRKVVADWVTDKDLRDELGVLEGLPKLATGTGWVWSPVRGILEKVAIRSIRTFDSYRTPKPGEARAEPKEIAPIDLDSLGEKIRATAEKAKADDPRELKKQIATLKREIATKPTGETVEVERVVEKRIEVPIEVPAVSDEQVAELRETATTMRDLSRGLSARADQIEEALRHVREPARREGARPPAHVDRGVAHAHRAEPQPHAPRPRPARASEDAARTEGEERLGKGELKVLGVLAEFPEGRTQNELAFLAGYSANASTIGVILSKLRLLGLVERGQPIRPTERGLEVVGGPVERPTGPELLDQWLHHPRMGEGERRVLRALIELYPHVPSTDELAELTGYSPTASTLGVILSKLRKLGLVQKGQRRVAEELMEAIHA